jgi:hypothetical protein
VSYSTSRRQSCTSLPPAGQPGAPKGNYVQCCGLYVTFQWDGGGGGLWGAQTRHTTW